MYYLINSEVNFPLCFSVLTLCSVDGSYGTTSLLLLEWGRSTDAQGASKHWDGSWWRPASYWDNSPGKQTCFQGNSKWWTSVTHSGPSSGMSLQDWGRGLALAPKQHSEDTTLAVTGLLCEVTADMCLIQGTQQHVQQDQTHCPCLCTVPRTSLWHPCQCLKGTSIHWCAMLPHQMWIYMHFLLEKNETE